MTPDGSSHDSTVTDDLLDRYVAGECAAAEAELVARWLAADPAPPARHARVERLRAVWQASRRPAGGPPENWDVDSAWHRVAAHLESLGGRSRPPRVLSLEVNRRERRRWAAWLPAPALWAAGLLFVAGSAALVWRLRPDAPAAVAAIPVREYVTERGERATFTLVDGTRVMLGAASKLAVPADYGRAAGDTGAFAGRGSAGPRTVTLEGEGYFDVVHDAARPFAVRAGRGLVRDIGTRFVVRAYTPDQPVEVAVTEGEVLLAEAHLRQGDLGRLDSAGAVRVERGADLGPYTGWIEGRIVFDDTPLADAIPTLERWYDLEITVADSALYGRRLFATLTAEPAAKVLDLVALSLDLRVERQGRSVTLHRRRQ